jgi:hypothetical protein
MSLINPIISNSNINSNTSYDNNNDDDDLYVVYYNQHTTQTNKISKNKTWKNKFKIIANKYFLCCFNKEKK